MAPGVIAAPVSFNTTAVGAIPPTTVTILGVAPFGPATITVTVGVVSATATFTVHAPDITIVPVGGVPGATVRVTGKGFPIGTVGNITAPGVIAPTGFTTTVAGGLPALPPPVLGVAVTILPGAPVGPATFTVSVDPDGPGPLPPVTATETFTAVSYTHLTQPTKA